MKTIVKNVLTNNKMFFVNDLSLVDNMVNTIISIEKNTCNLLDNDLRKKIITEHKLTENISRKNGRPFVFY